MPKPVINLDVDGLCADFVGATLLHVYMKHDFLFKRAACSAFNFHELPEFESFRESIVEAWNSQYFCSGLAPIIGSQLGVARLRSVADVRFVTAPMVTNPWWRRERTRWLRVFFDAPAKDVIFDHDKSAYAARLFVDDKPENVYSHQQKHPNGLSLIFAAPYNVGHEPCVHNWDQIATIGERLCRSRVSNLPTIKKELLRWLSDSAKKRQQSLQSA